MVASGVAISGVAAMTVSDATGDPMATTTAVSSGVATTAAVVGLGVATSTTGVDTGEPARTTAVVDSGVAA